MVDERWITNAESHATDESVEGYKSQQKREILYSIAESDDGSSDWHL